MFDYLNKLLFLTNILFIFKYIIFLNIKVFSTFVLNILFFKKLLLKNLIVILCYLYYNSYKIFILKR